MTVGSRTVEHAARGPALSALGGSPTLLVTLALGFQFAALLLPRDGGAAAVTYASPLVTTLVLLWSRTYRARWTGLVPLIALLVQAAVSVLLGRGALPNLVLSLATYSGFYLLALSPPKGGDTGRLRLWERLLIWSAVAVTAIGVAQLVAKGFPLRLPYIHFSPDAFEGPYGAGGHRLVPLLAGPALVLMTTRVVTGASPLLRSAPLVLLLAFGLVAPGANAMILALAVGVAAMVATVVALRYVRTLGVGGRLFARRMPARAVAVVAIALMTGGGLFVALGLGGLPHIQRSLASLVDVAAEDGPRNAKVAAAVDTLVELPRRDPLQPVVGVGLGSYSSWSQLLLSGVYVERFLAGRVAGLPVSFDEDAWDLVLWHISPEAYDLYGRWYVESISTQPWSSWQSLYAETGAVGLVLLLIAVAPLLTRLRARPRDDAAVRAARLTLGAYAWFAFTCGFIDNFFEYPWLTVPLLLGLLALPGDEAQA